MPDSKEKPGNPYRIEIFAPYAGISGFDAFEGLITNPIGINSTFRDNGNATVQIRLRESDFMNTTLMQDGVWARVFYRGKLEVTGKIRTRSGSFLSSGERTYQIRDDGGILDDLLGVVRTDLNGNQQSYDFLTPSGLNDEGQWWGGVSTEDLTGASGYFAWDQPPLMATQGFPSPLNTLPPDAETAMWKIWFANVARINDLDRLNVERYGDYPTVLDSINQHRGPAITLASQLPDVRMTKLSDTFAALTAMSGLSVRVLRGGPNPIGFDQDGGRNDGWPIGSSRFGLGLHLEIRTPDVWPAALTAEAGIIVSPSTWTINDPTATRVIVGGPGDLQSRVFYGTIDADLERRVRWVSEVFRDATSAQVTWPDTVPDNLRWVSQYANRPEVSAGAKTILLNALAAAASAGLAAGAATTSMNLTLAETGGFRYGGATGIQLGDRVTATKGDPSKGGVSLTDRLAEVEISWSRDGLKVTPKVGGYTDDPTRRLYEQVRQIAATQRKLSAGR